MHIIKVKSKKELELFINFQYDLYEGDKNFRPELKSELIDFFTNNPFLKKADITFYLAMRDKKPVGRIAKINIPHKPTMFGFFESVNDHVVADALFDEIDEQNGLVGPVNFTTNDTCGLLIQGYGVPSVTMPYNKRYYQELFEKYGLKKKMDLVAYYIPKETIPPQFRKNSLIREDKLKKENILIRTMDYKKFSEEIINLREVYNRSNRDNWGFMPISPGEMEYMAKRLKKITKPEYVFIAEKNGQCIGYLVSVPDINEITFKRGRLSLMSILKLWTLKPKKVKILILGMSGEYRELGIASCMINKVVDLTHRKKIHGAEASYILENNHQMNQILQKIKGIIYKKYRMYQK